MSYHETGLEKLSHHQLMKLHKGEGVIMKKGNHHRVHLSLEQHKKLHKNHLKGMGSKVIFDPYQISLHRGEGFFDSLKSIASNPIVKSIGKEVIKQGVPILVNKLTGSGFGDDLMSGFSALTGFGLHKKKSTVKKLVSKRVPKRVPKKKASASDFEISRYGLIQKKKVVRRKKGGALYPA